ncbi:MAG: hypothetical protein ACRENE_23745 [Polyangiaceae bacterium]
MASFVLSPRAFVFGTAALALGCGSGHSANFDNGGDSSSSQAPGGDASPGDATVASATDGGLWLGFRAAASEAGGVTQSVCIAGVYQGQFMTLVGSGANGGVEGGLFSTMWNGSLSIDLKAQKITMMTTTNSGENLTSTTTTSRLEIAEGGTLDGSDMYGGSFFADLSGELDCDPDAGPPYQLHATLTNGVYKQLFGSINMAGNLTADYQEAGASSPPMLVNGSILVQGLLMEGGAPFATASGSWSATWVSP